MRVFLFFALALMAPGLSATTIAPHMYVAEVFGDEIVMGLNSGQEALTGRRFGAVVVGERRTVRISIGCGSSPPLMLGLPAIPGANPDFDIDTSTFNASLTVGQETSFNIVFAPASTGAKTGQAVFQWFDPGLDRMRDFIVNVEGFGVGVPVPVIRVNEGSLADKPVYPGTNYFLFWSQGDDQRGPRTFFVTNDGDPGAADLVLGVPVLDGEAEAYLALDLSGFDTTLAPGQSTSFTVTYSPGDKPHDRDGIITFSHNDAYQALSVVELRVNAWRYEEDEDDPWYLFDGCAAGNGASCPLFAPLLALLLLRRRKKACNKACRAAGR